MLRLVNRYVPPFNTHTRLKKDINIGCIRQEARRFVGFLQSRSFHAGRRIVDCKKTRAAVLRARPSFRSDLSAANIGGLYRRTICSPTARTPRRDGRSRRRAPRRVSESDDRPQRLQRDVGWEVLRSPARDRALSSGPGSTEFERIASSAGWPRADRRRSIAGSVVGTASVVGASGPYASRRPMSRPQAGQHSEPAPRTVEVPLRCG